MTYNPSWPSSDPAVRRHYAQMHRLGGRKTVGRLSARRRLQALQCLGYTWADLAARTGVGYSTLSAIANDYASHDRESLRVSVDRAVRRVYSELYLTPATDSTASRRVRVQARKKDWAPPLAWDDIDNPKERPKKGVLTVTWRQNHKVSA